jgi:hypothetical protein
MAIESALLTPIAAGSCGCKIRGGPPRHGEGRPCAAVNAGNLTVNEFSPDDILHVINKRLDQRG